MTSGSPSAREAEVLAAVRRHLTNTEIAQQLHISVRTVESHISSLLRKLGATDRRSLARLGDEPDAPPVAGVEMPPTRYVRVDDLDIAFQVLDGGPDDLVMVMGSFWHLEFQWTDPSLVGCLDRLSTFSRVIMFDKRGTGMSDRLPGSRAGTVAERRRDLLAVLDAAGSEQAVLFAESEGGPMALTFALAHPERVRGLVLFGTFPRLSWSPEVWWGLDDASLDIFLQWTVRTWGGPESTIEPFAPSWGGDPERDRWFATLQRMTGPPHAGLDLMRMGFEIDVTEALPRVAVPTLVLHRRGDRIIPVAGARYLAERIPGSRLVELDGDDHLFQAGDSSAIFDEVRAFMQTL